MTAATMDASAVRSAGLYCLSPVVFRFQVPASRGPAHNSAVTAVWFGPICGAVPPLLLCGGGFQWASLQQRLLAPPRAEGGWGRLWEALRAQALRVRGILVLLAVLGGRLGGKRSWCR